MWGRHGGRSLEFKARPGRCTPAGLRPHSHPLITAHCPEFQGSSRTAEPWLQVENMRNPALLRAAGAAATLKLHLALKQWPRKPSRATGPGQQPGIRHVTAESAGWGARGGGTSEVTVGARSCLATRVRWATCTALTSQSGGSEFTAEAGEELLQRAGVEEGLGRELEDLAWKMGVGE